MSHCPFCKRDPYHYADVGVGYVPVAIVCCDLGVALYNDDKVAKRALRDMQNPSPRAKARARKVIKEYGGLE